MSDTPIRAAQYVRMSTEHQQYSTENQSDALAEYARKRGYEIVRTFGDAGKSGLDIRGRDGLRELLDVVASGSADFKAILVYDVSRWGRFQDTDQSAHYEYLCREAGISVQYCAEQFENDGTPIASIVKAIKRMTAGEYSRELSAKVFRGQCRLITLGFRQGGPAGFGLRRMLLDSTGAQKCELKFTERKSLQTDRVVLVPGPPEEIAAVRRVYDLFLDGKVEREIANALNDDGVRTDRDRAWTRSSVHQLLTNEKYIGHNVYNRVSFKLKAKRVHNPPEQWIRRESAFTPIVSAETFFTVRGMIIARHQRLSDDELLARLEELRARVGRVSGVLIDESEGMPSSAVYRHRFGSLERAYRLIGYCPEHDFAFVETNRQLRQLHPDIVARVVQAVEGFGGTVVRNDATDLLTLNGRVTVSVVLARHQSTESGASRWTIGFDRSLSPDITIAVRMNGTNTEPLDYYVLPSLDAPVGRLRVAEENALDLDAYRFETLEEFAALVEEVSLEDAA